MKESEAFSIRRFTSKDLASHYRCSERTINRWVNRLNIGKPMGHFYSADQVRQIVEKVTNPAYSVPLIPE